MRILFVAPSDDLASATWINQVSVGTGWDVHWFPVGEAMPSRDIRNVTLYDAFAAPPESLDRSVAHQKGLWPLPRGAGRAVSLIHLFRPTFFDRATWLEWVIRRIKPDVVQSVGLSVGGTLTYLAKSRSREKFPPWIAADWESQMQLLDYMSLGAIDPSAVLSSCDYYLCQSPRDLEEARNKRFLGQALPFFPNGGAIDISHCSQFRQPGPASKRRLILVNGCPQWPGRAFVALRAIERAAHQLDGYRVAVYQPLPEIEIKAELIAQDTGIPFDMIHHASNDDVFQLLGRSRVYLGLQVSGAVTSLFFHALAMGAFPIQSASSFADELKLLFYGYCVWISNGLTGLLVPPEDPGPVAEAICKAAVDDALVDNAAQENRRMVTQLLDIHQVRPQIMAMYEKVATDERIRLS